MRARPKAMALAMPSAAGSNKAHSALLKNKGSRKKLPAMVHQKHEQEKKRVAEALHTVILHLLRLKQLPYGVSNSHKPETRTRTSQRVQAERQVTTNNRVTRSRRTVALGDCHLNPHLGGSYILLPFIMFSTVCSLTLISVIHSRKSQARK